MKLKESNSEFHVRCESDNTMKKKLCIFTCRVKSKEARAKCKPHLVVLLPALHFGIDFMFFIKHIVNTECPLMGWRNNCAIAYRPVTLQKI
jgi:hypothetical protein